MTTKSELTEVDKRSDKKPKHSRNAFQKNITAAMRTKKYTDNPQGIEVVKKLNTMEEGTGVSPTPAIIKELCTSLLFFFYSPTEQTAAFA